MKKTLISFIIYIFVLNSNTYSNEIKIEYKIDNQIITNIDIDNEIKYLQSLNKNLENLSKKKIKEIALNSVIQEKVKYIELSKYFDLTLEDNELEKIIYQNLYNNLNLENKIQLDNYFNEYGLNLEDIFFKFKIELLWNKLIYEKYISNVVLDKKKLKDKIKEDISQKEPIEEFNLKEILFNVDNNDTVENKYSKILQTINETGFENAANIYSLSNTSKYGGSIGWLKKTQLSKTIYSKIKNLEISKPIQASNGYLIIKVEEKRFINEKINEKEELEKLLRKETDRQLNNFSTIFFNKIKKNIIINEI